MLLSSLPDATMRESMENCAVRTQLEWPLSVWRNLRLCTSQILTSLSSEAETSKLPSWLKSIDLTGAAWPLITEQCALALLFQTLTVVSRETDAIRVPCGLTATSQTGPVWPINLFGRALAERPHARIRPSLELEMTCFRLGWKQADVTFSLCPCSAFRT